MFLDAARSRPSNRGNGSATPLRVSACPAVWPVSRSIIFQSQGQPQHRSIGANPSRIARDSIDLIDRSVDRTGPKSMHPSNHMHRTISSVPFDPSLTHPTPPPHTIPQTKTTQARRKKEPSRQWTRSRPTCGARCPPPMETVTVTPTSKWTRASIARRSWRYVPM